jgi:predicted permease
MPFTSAVVVVSIGAGIAVNTTVFSFVQSRVLRPLPGVHAATALHLIEPKTDTGMYPASSWLEYRDIVDRMTAFAAVFAFRMQALTVGAGVEAARVSGLMVSGNYFDALGMRPAAGRLLAPRDAARPGGEPVSVISYEYWQSQFAGSPDVLGRTLRVNGTELAIVGVTPPAFKGTVIGLRIDLWVPATLAPTLLNGSRELEQRGARGYLLAGRLRDGVRPEQAQVELLAAMNDLAAIHPETNRGMTGDVLPFWQSPRGPQRMLARSLFILQGLMLVLLLAVCGNAATLLLARAAERQQEVGVHLALGAPPVRIVRLLLAENTLLAVLGAAVGAVAAAWLAPRLAAIPLTTGFPVRMDAAVDGTGLLFASGLGAASALLFGLIPALHLARVDPLRALRGSRATARTWIRHLLMAAQTALAVMVLVAAGVFLRSLQQTRDIDPGFSQDGVLLGRYDLTGQTVPPSAARRFAERALDGLRSLPAVEAAAIAQQVPLDIHGLPGVSMVLEGRARTNGMAQRVQSNVVTPGYFHVMRIPVLAGRDFVELGDTVAPREVVVNRAFVERHLPDAEPLGRRVEVAGRVYVVVGIVATTVSDAFGEPPTPVLYFSYRDRPSPVGQLHVRSRLGDTAALAAGLRSVVAAIDPTLPVYDIRSLAQHVDANLGLRKIPAQVFMFLGPMLLVLAAVGVYAAVASAVTHRTPEIGVRLALGATPRGIMRTVLGGTLRVVFAGTVAGSLAAVLVARQLASIAPEPAVIMSAALFLLAAAALASWLPARRAAAVDPVIALKTT